MPRILPCLLPLLATLGSSAFAVLPYSGGDYIQTFDSLGTGAVSWADHSTLPGWYAHQSGSGAPPASLHAPLTSGSSTASNSKGRWFNFGADADRTLGGSPNTASGTHSYGLALTNSTGTTLTGFTVSFDWEQWFDADITDPQNLRLAYSTNASSLNSGTYTEIADARLTLTGGGSQVWLASPSVFSRSVTVSGLTWAPGTQLWLRWQDINEAGGDHGVGIDNVAFSASAEPPPPAPAPAVAVGPWSGAVTPGTARVHVKMNQPASGARLVVSTEADFAAPRRFDPLPGHANLPVASFALDALPAGQTHHYAIEFADGTLDLARRGRFRTLPAGPASFSFAFSACSNTGSDHRVFDHIAAANPLFYLNVGDFHYRDIGVDDPALFRSAFDTVFGSPRQAALYRAVPLAYIWDDHDYGPNDSDRTAPGRPASLQVYREYIPHYPLAFADADAPIDQSFVVGRARFILSDLRSRRNPKSQTDDLSKRMLNSAQLDWWKQEILAAQAARQAVFWVSSVPWIGVATSGSDLWAGYSTQRRELANFLAENRVENLVILSGDAHMLAADDGRNANFTTDPDAPKIRVLQAGALDRGGSTKGGPYSQGTSPGGGRYGHVTVTDLGETLHVRFSGRAIDATNGAMTEPISLEFTLDLGPLQPPPTPALGELRLEHDGALSFSFKGEPFRAYRVQSSPDLQNWTQVGVPSQPQPGRFMFAAPPPADEQPRRFYRVLVD
jgi:phosphodiesterase/alkaline phosphatase D-like protein